MLTLSLVGSLDGLKRFLRFGHVGTTWWLLWLNVFVGSAQNNFRCPEEFCSLCGITCGRPGGTVASQEDHPGVEPAARKVRSGYPSTAPARVRKPRRVRILATFNSELLRVCLTDGPKIFARLGFAPWGTACGQNYSSLDTV
jgi:hypothetical protein